MQLIAGYISESVKKSLESFPEDNINGLLKYLSHFDLELNTTPLDTKNQNPFVSVINNIITRGIPTKPSIFIEKSLNIAFKKAKQEVPIKLGSINYIPNFSKEEKKLLFNALHIIEPRLKLSEKNYKKNVLESNFEKDFLFKYLNDKNANYVIQLLETQRKLDTIIHPDKAKDYHSQRVDFSIEFPYQLTENYVQYGEKKERKYFYGSVIEIDGSDHTKLEQSILDKNRNIAINEVHWNIFRIDNLNTTNFYEYFADSTKIHKSNYQKGINGDWSDILQLVLTPFAIARIQKTIIELICSEKLNIEDEKWTILVYEKDVPCAELAFKDLSKMFNNLFELANSGINFPEIDLEIISTKEFIDSPLHKINKIKTEENFVQKKDYDLFIDIAVLTRVNIVEDGCSFNAKNIAKIRSIHYIDSERKMKTSDLIKYQAITIKNENEKYNVIKKAEKPLKYFLQNIFRKENFRQGQLPILNRALQLQSVIGLLPTGGGKSLTYQLASMLQPGVTIVIDPIKSLMQDQYDNLLKNGIDCCHYINSKLDTTERIVATNELVEGKVLFSFISPERLQIQEFRGNLKAMYKNNIYFSYGVIDEVHCVSEWGHDFRTSYLSLGKNILEFCKIKNSEKTIPIFGLTATASFDVLSDVERELSGDGKSDIDTNAIVRFENSNRDELQYKIIDVKADFDVKEEYKIEISENETVIDLPKPIEEDVKLKITKTKQNELIKLFDELPKLLGELNDDSQNLVKKAIKREFQKSNVERESIKIENFSLDTFYTKDKMKNGGIVFCPHRTWFQGVTDRFKFEKHLEDVPDEYGNIIHSRGDFVLDANGHKVKLPPAQRDGVSDKIESSFSNFKVGFFMGSSDENEKVGKEIEKASFENQEKFINNKQNVMVATKAFGMGIDKPNVRYTVHYSVPSSIESFVQEAGRAGRDRKIALSTILYNKQEVYYFNETFYKKIKSDISEETFKKLNHLKEEKFFKKDIKQLFQKLDIPSIQNFEKHIGKIFVDKDNLLFFHNNSFKGQEKEKYIIYELLNNISFQKIINVRILSEKIKEIFNIENFSLNFVETTNTIWVNGTFQNNYGSINIANWNYFYFGIFPRELVTEIFDYIKNEISNSCNVNNLIEVRNWLLTEKNKDQEQGIEKRLKKINVDQEIKPEIVIEFSNKISNSNEYYNQLKNEIDILVPNNTISIKNISNSITQKFEKFKEKLIKIDLNFQLIEEKKLWKLKLLFYSPRKKADTDKGIFRLMSIGVIDDYTVDYNKKTYTLKVIKKSKGEYFNNLEKFIRRYYSDGKAKFEIEKAKEYKGESEIQKCLGYLTDFVYSEIEKKRLRSIDDILLACEIGLQENGNEDLKDYIFLYFNSKYARNDYKIEGEDYSLTKDINNNQRNDFELIWKYIIAIEIDSSGAQKDNVKHLRGACLRLLRSNTENGSLLLLKSFSLFVLGFENNKVLEEETKKSFINGFKIMRNLYPNFSFKELIEKIQKFRNLTIKNANKEKEVEKIIDTYIDILYIDFHNDWLKTFNNKFLLNYDR